MSESASSKKEKSKRVVSRRRVLRTTSVVAGTGISAALFGTTPVGAQQTLDFGEVAVGSSDTRTVSQPNPTDRTLPITGVEITGPDADQFSVVDGGAPFTLRADESRTITIEFAPTSPGQKSASIQIEIAGGTTQTAGQLTGTGVSETTENGDDSTTDASTSSSQEVSTDESAPATSDTPASEETSSTGTETGDSQSIEGESAAEDSTASPSDTSGSTPTEDESPSIILMLDFNDNGVLDLQDVMTLIHMLG